MVQSQYIRDILTLLLDDDEYALLSQQVEYIKDETFDYTNSGVFVNFKHEEQGLNYKQDNQHIRLNGVLIKSDEIDIAAEASLVINDGLIDYLEIWSYGDIYPSADLTHYTLEQQWKDEPDRKKIVR